MAADKIANHFTALDRTPSIPGLPVGRIAELQADARRIRAEGWGRDDLPE